MTLSPQQKKRYQRHINLREIGEAGQLKLSRAKVVVIGAGGLGNPSLLYLAAAGVGCLGIVDFDAVEESNLQRQVLFGTSQLGEKKAEAARARLQDLNPHIEFRVHSRRIDANNALDLLSEYQVVVDGTDNFSTRYLVNDACSLLGLPLVSASIERFQGQISTFHTAEGYPCYRCLHPQSPPAALAPNCAEAGVLGVLPGILGSLQATEVIKLILGLGQDLRGRLLIYDALKTSFREIAIPKSSNCPICGDSPSLTDLKHHQVCPEISVDELKAQLHKEPSTQLVDVREAEEWESGNLSAFGAIHLPLSKLESDSVNLDRDQELVLYCQSGARGREAWSTLKNLDFRQVKNLAGGFKAWQRSPSTPE